MENSIQEEWGVEPLRIREGGVRMSPIVSTANTIGDLVHSLSPIPGKGIRVPCTTSPNGTEFGDLLLLLDWRKSFSFIS